LIVQNGGTLKLMHTSYHKGRPVRALCDA